MSPYSVSAAGFHPSAAWMLRFMGVSTLGAVTPTNRYGSAGPSPAAKRRAAERPRMIVSAGDGEGGAQARDLEDLAGRGLEPPQLDAATALAGPLQCPDEHAEAGRVDEVHTGELDDDLAGALFDQPVELVPQRRRGAHVDLALAGARRRPPLVTPPAPTSIPPARVN